MLNLHALHEGWAASSQGKRRAQGGRAAFSGFLYQLYISLDGFFAQVIEGNVEAQYVFDGLSDIASLQEDVLYLTQVKTTVDPSSLKSAVNEAFAVWQYLSEIHPEVQARVRFQIAARRVNPDKLVDIRTLTVENLGLSNDQAHLWAVIREKFLPLKIIGNPKVDLAIRLWPHVNECLSFTESCLGRLFALLGENRSSTQITEDLLDIWEKARAKNKPPGKLLGRLWKTPPSCARMAV